MEKNKRKKCRQEFKKNLWDFPLELYGLVVPFWHFSELFSLHVLEKRAKSIFEFLLRVCASTISISDKRYFDGPHSLEKVVLLHHWHVFNCVWTSWIWVLWSNSWRIVVIQNMPNYRSTSCSFTRWCEFGKLFPTKSTSLRFSWDFTYKHQHIWQGSHTLLHLAPTNKHDDWSNQWTNQTIPLQTLALQFKIKTPKLNNFDQNVAWNDSTPWSVSEARWFQTPKQLVELFTRLGHLMQLSTLSIGPESFVFEKRHTKKKNSVSKVLNIREQW